MPVLKELLAQIKFIVCDVDGVLTDGRIWFDGDGQPFRSMYVRDGTGLTLWRLSGGKAALVSGLGSKAVESVAKQWKCEELHTYVMDKPTICKEMAERHGVTLEEMAFIGDDIIDMRALQTVGLGVAVADAADEVKAVADLVLDRPGGAGPVRELVHMILKAQGRYDEIVDLYCSRKNDAQ